MMFMCLVRVVSAPQGFKSRSLFVNIFLLDLPYSTIVSMSNLIVILKRIFFTVYVNKVRDFDTPRFVSSE